MSTILWCCPSCGNDQKLKERVTQKKRKCSQCGTPITTDEIDRQAAEVEAEIARKNAQAFQGTIITLAVVGAAIGSILIASNFSPSREIASQPSNQTSNLNEPSLPSAADSVTEPSMQTDVDTLQSPDTELMESSSETQVEELPAQVTPEEAPTVSSAPNIVASMEFTQQPVANRINSYRDWFVEPQPSTIKKIDHLILFSSDSDSEQLKQLLEELREQDSNENDSDSAKTAELKQTGSKALAANNYEEAAQCFAYAGKLKNSDPEILSKLAYAQTQLSMLDPAKKNLYQSLSLAPLREVAWDDLALLFAKQHQQEKAVACFLIGYRISDGKTLSYLQSLNRHEDLAVRLAADTAVQKVTDYP